MFSILAAVLLVPCILPSAHGAEEEGGMKMIDLREVCTLTLKNHEQILIARKEIDKSRLLPKKANSIMLPKVNLYGEYREYEDDITFEAELGAITLPPIITVPEHQTGGNFEIVQPLYKGSWLPRKEQAKQSVIRDKEEYYEVAQAILFQASQIYYEVVKSKQLVTLTHEILKLVEEEKRVARARYEEGAVTEDAVLNADLKITSTQSKLIEYNNRLTLTREILQRFIGEDIGPYDVLSPAEQPTADGELPDLIGIALDNRHDYRKALVLGDLAQADLRLAKSRFHPSLESSWDYFSVDNPSYYQDTDYWIFAVQLTIPLYEGGLRHLDVKEKKENIIQAELAARDLNKNIRLEVEEALLQIKTMEGVLDNLRKQEDLARKNYDIVSAKFKFGAASSVDLNQAISTLDAVQTEFVVKKIDLQIAMLKLEKTIGLLGRDLIPPYED
jgi:outer membrane protein TolC